jgi:hypothetical protein
VTLLYLIQSFKKNVNVEVKCNNSIPGTQYSINKVIKLKFFGQDFGILANFQEINSEIF